jgi:hypothetical protein
MTVNAHACVVCPTNALAAVSSSGGQQTFAYYFEGPEPSGLTAHAGELPSVFDDPEFAAFYGFPTRRA